MNFLPAFQWPMVVDCTGNNTTPACSPVFSGLRINHYFCRRITSFPRPFTAGIKIVSHIAILPTGLFLTTYSVYRQRSRTHLFLQFCLFILDFLTLSSSTTVPVWVMNLGICLYAYIFPTNCLNESSPSCLLIYVFKRVWDKESWWVMEKREPSDNGEEPADFFARPSIGPLLQQLQCLSRFVCTSGWMPSRTVNTALFLS